MSRKADRRQVAAPGVDVPLQIRDAHIRIVQAADDEAREGKRRQPFFTKLYHAGMKMPRRLQRTWRDEQCAADFSGDAAPGITRCQKTSKAVPNEKGSIHRQKRPVQFRLPVLEDRTTPVLLLDD